MPVRDRALLTALTKVTACLEEPQFTSGNNRANVRLGGIITAPLKARMWFTQLTWLLDGDVNVEQEFDCVREQSCPPVDDKHDRAAEQRAQQRQPHVVVLIPRSPP